ISRNPIEEQRFLNSRRTVCEGRTDHYEKTAGNPQLWTFINWIIALLVDPPDRTRRSDYSQNKRRYSLSEIRAAKWIDTDCPRRSQGAHRGGKRLVSRWVKEREARQEWLCSPL